MTPAKNRYGLIDGIDTLGNVKIFRAGQFKIRPQKISRSPFDEFRPHWTDQNQWRPDQFPNLQKLPDHRQLQHRADSTRNDNKGVGHQDEVMQPRKKSPVLIGLINEGVNFLFEGQVHTDP
ncbi:MAG: hypothetical protein A4E72_01352 [Syntrophus sp. PtaU1.Bin208]|nr:MAG: hypothetical protein A4E72_01352 [Syntrophus sp. PtaU1.Bin208]